jgi:hypothetical protein
MQANLVKEADSPAQMTNDAVLFGRAASLTQQNTTGGVQWAGMTDIQKHLFKLQLSLKIG